MAQHRAERTAATDEHLGRAAIAFVRQHGGLRRGGVIDQHVLGHLRIIAAKYRAVGRGGLAQRVVRQRRVELLHRLAGHRRHEAHVAEAALVRIPRHTLRRGAAAGPRQGVGQQLAAVHVEHVQGGQLAAALGAAVGQVAPFRRGPVAGDGGAAVVGIGVHQRFGGAVGPGLRDHHRLWLRRGLLQVEQRAAGQHRAAAGGGGDRQLAHPRGERRTLGHLRQFGLGVGVLCADPRLHLRIVGGFQPAVGVGHGHAVQLAAVGPRGGRRRQQALADQRHVARRRACDRRRRRRCLAETGRGGCEHQDGHHEGLAHDGNSLQNEGTEGNAGHFDSG